MKQKSILFAAVAALALGVNTARAEDQPKHEKEKGAGHHKEAFIEKYDTNKDGALSKEELAAMPEAQRTRVLERFDTNKDGELSKEELEATPAKKEKPAEPKK